MFKSEIHGEFRNEKGSNACHRIREKGYVPGVVYGHHMPSRTVEVDRKELDTIIRQYGTNAMLDLQLGPTEATVMLKDIQRNPVTKEIIHVDFQEISQNEAVSTAVPIRLVGKDRVRSKDGVVQQQLRELQIECLPKFIPESIEVDITRLSPGHPLRVSDVEFGSEISILNDPQEIIAALAKAERMTETVEEDKDLLEKISAVTKD